MGAQVPPHPGGPPSWPRVLAHDCNAVADAGLLCEIHEMVSGRHHEIEWMVEIFEFAHQIDERSTCNMASFIFLTAILYRIALLGVVRHLDSAVEYP